MRGDRLQGACVRPYKAWLALAILSIAALSGCAGVPFEFRAQTEIPDGPGLFTGQRGALVLAGDETSTAMWATVRPKASGLDARGHGDEYREFDAYLEYRRAKSERSIDYREFLEWLEWRRYRAWKQRRDGEGH